MNNEESRIELTETASRLREVATMIIDNDRVLSEILGAAEVIEEVLKPMITTADMRDAWSGEAALKD